MFSSALGSFQPLSTEKHKGFNPISTALCNKYDESTPPESPIRQSYFFPLISGMRIDKDLSTSSTKIPEAEYPISPKDFIA